MVLVESEASPWALGGWAQPCLASKNAYASPAEIAGVRPDSPAGQAGFKKGDRIVEINGKPIKTQTDLRFVIGPAYGGDAVRVVAMRGGERIERTITLIGELPVFRHGFLGILPNRPALENASATGEKEKNPKEEKNSGDKKDDQKKASDDATKSDKTALRWLSCWS